MGGEVGAMGSVGEEGGVTRFDGEDDDVGGPLAGGAVRGGVDGVISGGGFSGV